MSSPSKAEGMERKETGDLKISAAIANQPRSEPSTTASSGLHGKLSVDTSTGENGAVRAATTCEATTTTTKKLPPSPLVTPPMGSNPSQAAQEAVSPRNLNNPDSPKSSASQEAPPDTTAPGSATRKTKHEQKGIPHVYHDYSKLSGPGPAYIRKKTGGVTQPFPDKLHEMLAQESSDDPASAIVSWLPHGRAFIVRKPKEFTTEVMPKYFRQTKLTSFQRQLNLYGFRRITQGADSGAYYHPLFLQGRPSLSQRMVRQKVKGTGHKQPSDASSEPNFYSMPPVEPEYPATSTFGARYKPTILPPLQQQPPAVAVAATRPLEAAAQAAAAATTSTLIHRGIDPNSPGFSSLHGAAQLLHGISAGARSGAFLGPPAASVSARAASLASNGTQPKPASFLQPDQLKDTDDHKEYKNIASV